MLISLLIPVCRRASCALTFVLLATIGEANAQGPIQLQGPAQGPAQAPAAPAPANGSRSPGATPDPVPATPGGPPRLRQLAPDQVLAPATPAPVPAVVRPGEFESFVGLPRFGAELVNELAAGATDYSPVIPPEYVIQGGDEIQLTLWGSVDADLRLIVDRSGRVTIPRVGPVLLAGTRYAELHDTLARRVGQVFKNFELSASLGRLRGVRVYVTGFVQRPGAYSVAALSTVMNVVMRAGGPASAGSFRHIELRRDGRAVANFDLYDLLLRGDRSGDRLVQPDDVIHVMPVGTQVALRGSVNKQAVFEVRTGETFSDLLRMAGGLTPVADRSRVALERLDDRNGVRVVQLSLPANDALALANGDILRVFSSVESTLSVERQNRRVRIDGEVMLPGEYVLPPGSTLSDAVRIAGGISPSAFLYGAQFSRESVRAAQIENYDRALRDLETDFARASASKRVSSNDEAATQSAQAASTSRLIERLRALQPTGRVVLQLAPEATELPALLLEDGDRLFVPARPSSVGVFGSVFNSGNYLYLSGRTLDDYLRVAGGPTRGADEGSVFVVRANGQVVSSRQSAGWFRGGNQIGNVRAEAGDTVFVPEEMDKTTFIQTAKDWTLLLYQLGIGVAGIKSAVR